MRDLLRSDSVCRAPPETLAAHRHQLNPDNVSPGGAASNNPSPAEQRRARSVFEARLSEDGLELWREEEKVSGNFFDLIGSGVVDEGRFVAERLLPTGDKNRVFQSLCSYTYLGFRHGFFSQEQAHYLEKMFRALILFDDHMNGRLLVELSAEDRASYAETMDRAAAACLHEVSRGLADREADTARLGKSGCAPAFLVAAVLSVLSVALMA